MVVPIKFTVIIKIQPPIEIAVHIPIPSGTKPVNEPLRRFRLRQCPYTVTDADLPHPGGIVHIVIASIIDAAAERLTIALIQCIQVLGTQLLQLRQYIRSLPEALELLPCIFVGTVFKQQLRERQTHQRHIGVGFQSAPI